jgi:hypothetical protein
LRDECEQVEESFPESVHREHFVRRIAVQKECLTEEREEPMSDKENGNGKKIHRKLIDGCLSSSGCFGREHRRAFTVLQAAC